MVCNLLQVTKPKFQLPHRTFIVFPEAYRDSYLQQRSVQYNKSVDITMPAMFIHVPYIDKNTLQSRCLQMLEVPHDHDTPSLKDVIPAIFLSLKY